MLAKTHWICSVLDTDQHETTAPRGRSGYMTACVATNLQQGGYTKLQHAGINGTSRPTAVYQIEDSL